MKLVVLAVMAVLSFLSMYILMYMMVNSLSDIYPNINQLYMATIMTAPMIIFEVLLMRSMYTNKTINAFIIGISVTFLVLFSFFIRAQAAVSDIELLKSMIPHHSGAILMCKEANLGDREVQELCERIISSQQLEIETMKRKLNELEN